MTVTATNDNVFESTHTTSVSPLISASGLFAYPSVSITPFTVTITDNDTASVTVSAVTGSATEGGGNATYTLVLTSQPTSTVTIALTTDTGETSLGASTVSFTTGNWSSAQTVTVSALNDAIDEPNYTTSVTHLITTSGLLGYTSVLSISAASISLVDNDTAAVTITPTSISLAEGRADTYSVVLLTPPTSTVQVVLSPEPGLSLSATTLSFTTGSWNTPQTVTVTSVDDTVFVGDRTRFIVETPSTTAFGYQAIALGTITVAIVEDDSRGGGSGGGTASTGGTVATVGSLASVAATTPVPLPPPIIILQGESLSPSPSVPSLSPRSEVVTILNPTDVVSLVEATNAARNFEFESKNQARINKTLRSSVFLSPTLILELANFVTYGISERTRLFRGETLLYVRSRRCVLLISIRPILNVWLEIIPLKRNLRREEATSRVRSTFRSIYGHDPNFKDAEENIAWNTLMYHSAFREI